jgi:energy-coupling factor transport system ATP-binding protein
VLALGRDGRPIDLGAPAEVMRRSRGAMTAAGIWLPEVAPTPRGRRRAGSAASPAVPEAPLGQASSAGALVAAEAYGAWFSYERGRPVLCDVEVAISPGERAALVGPNGSGKSTLARLLVGLLRPDRGLVRLASRDPAALSPDTLARLAGYVFQDPERQFLTGSVRDEVHLGLRRHEARDVPDLMARLNLPLEEFGRRNPYRLSGGEQRRLSLACVLVRRPDLLVLDEPTFGQDRHGYEGLLAILADRLAEGSAILAVTHDERLVRDLAARRIEMSDGRIVSHGWSS